MPESWLVAKAYSRQGCGLAGIADLGGGDLLEGRTGGADREEEVR